MPIKGARYRWADPGKPGGPKVRLAFKGDKVVEAKSSSGKIHTQSEFAKEAKKRLSKARSKK